MSTVKLIETIRRSTANTLIADAFRRAIDMRDSATPLRTMVKRDRYQGARILMRQRYGVRM